MRTEPAGRSCLEGTFGLVICRGGALDGAIFAAGLEVEALFGDVTGAAPAPGDDFETLVLRHR